MYNQAKYLYAPIFFPVKQMRKGSTYMQFPKKLINKFYITAITQLIMEAQQLKQNINN